MDDEKLRKVLQEHLDICKRSYQIDSSDSISYGALGELRNLIFEVGWQIIDGKVIVTRII
jgi:hypothetical protein